MKTEVETSSGEEDEDGLSQVPKGKPNIVKMASVSSVPNLASMPLVKLSDNNYFSWSKRMKHYLICLDLWECISTEPDKDDDESVRRDSKAMSIIILSLDDSQFVYIENEKTASDVWNALRQAHVKDTAGAKIALMRQLFRAKQSPGESICDHVRKINNIFHQLSEAGMDHEEEYRCLVILSSLDTSYDGMVMGMEALKSEDLTISYVQSRLQQEEQRRLDNKVNRLPVVKQQSAGETIQMVRKCFICGSEKHLKRHCDKINKGDKNKKQKQKQFAAKERRQQDDNHQVSVINVHNSKQPQQELFIIDSGASIHCVNDRNLLESLTLFDSRNVTLADGTQAKMRGEGKLFFKPLGCEFERVLYIPSLKCNLLSVPMLVKMGFGVQFGENKCKIVKDGKVLAMGKLQDNLFVINTAEASVNTVQNKPLHDRCIHILHRRLGHLSFEAIKKTLQCVDDGTVQNCNKYLDCHVCKSAKSKSAPIAKRSFRQSEQPLQLIHMDVIGPLAPSIGGSRFCLVITDDYSRYSWVYIMKHKSQVFAFFKEWFAMAERRYKHQVKTVQTDRGSEFLSNQFVGYLKNKGVKHRLTNPSASAEHGISERKNGVLQGLMNAMLEDSKLKRGYWAEAMKCANYVSNRVWSSAINNVPYALLYDKKPTLKYMRTFGTEAWVHIPKKYRRKDSPKSRKLIFIGFQSGAKAWRFCDDHGKVYISRSASFCEQRNWKDIHANDEVFMPSMTHTHYTQPSSHESASVGGDVESERVEEDKDEVVEERIIPRRSTRSNFGVPPERFTINLISHEPQSYKEMLQLPECERKYWRMAMEKEYESLEKHQVFTPVSLPEGQKTVGCRWTYKVKKSSDNTVTCKARLVAQGFSQEKYVNYDEVFAPTVKAETFRMALAIAAARKCQVHHFDVETAYLNANLKEDIYMRQIPGYELGNPELVLKLNKALYGLRQSGLAWNQCLHQKLTRLGFSPSRADPCLYTKGSIILLVFVDDLCLIVSDISHVKWFISTLGAEVKIKHLGEVQHYLGTDVLRDPEGNFYLCQGDKIEKLLQKCKMEDCKPVSTPMEVGFNRIPEDGEYCNVELYQSVLGSLMYLSSWSRPDISAAVNMLSQHAAKPQNKHWKGIKHILRYLQGTVHAKLKISACNNLDLVSYADADWGSCPESRRSISGYAIFLGDSLIAWKSRKQRYIACSTAESEYGALSDLCCDLTWFVQLLKDVKVTTQLPVKVYNDSLSCIQLAQSHRIGSRSKHIGIRYQNVKDCVDQQLIVLEYCTSDCNCADIFTKALPKERHICFRERLGVEIC